jgi:uncharacterized protein (UPF0335 family)
MATLGDNSVDKAALKSVVERIVNLETEKKGLSEDICDVYEEAKGRKLDPKALRRTVRRKLLELDPEKLAKEKAAQDQADIYNNLLGLLD